MPENIRTKLLNWCISIGLKGLQTKVSGETTIQEDLLAWRAKPDATLSGQNILKYNFGGSGQKAWKTSLDSKGNVDSEAMMTESGDSGMMKHEKSKLGESDYDLKLEVEYAGPIGKESLGGLFDLGSNKTSKVIKNAYNDFDLKMKSILAWQLVNDNSEKIIVQVKGFSRGGAAASKFVSLISKSSYRENITIQSVFFDPVHGSGSMSKLASFLPSMLAQQESSIELELAPQDVSARIYPVKANFYIPNFEPQRITGVKKICIVYGQNANHDSGHFGEYTYKRKPLKGIEWTNIPNGLWVVDSSNIKFDKPKSDGNKRALVTEEISQLKTLQDVEDFFAVLWNVQEVKGFFTGKTYLKRDPDTDVSTFENRDIQLFEIIERFFPSKFVTEYEEWYAESQQNYSFIKRSLFGRGTTRKVPKLELEDIDIAPSPPDSPKVELLSGESSSFLKAVIESLEDKDDILEAQKDGENVAEGGDPEIMIGDILDTRRIMQEADAEAKRVDEEEGKEAMANFSTFSPNKNEFLKAVAAASGGKPVKAVKAVIDIKLTLASKGTLFFG